jgi:hypothetical protein
MVVIIKRRESAAHFGQSISVLEISVFSSKGEGRREKGEGRREKGEGREGGRGEGGLCSYVAGCT